MRILLVPVFLLFMGIVAFAGMGNGSSGFSGKFTVKNILGQLVCTMCVGLVTTVGVIVFYELIQMVVPTLSTLQERLGIR